MGSRRHEVLYLLLDVGAPMGPHLPHAARGLAGLLTARALHRPDATEAALVLFGTAGTDNDVHRDCAADAEAPDAAQYLHVTLALRAGPHRTGGAGAGAPGAAHLRALADVADAAEAEAAGGPPRPTGRADAVDALVVAADAVLRARAAADAEGPQARAAFDAARKRAVLVSSLRGAGPSGGGAADAELVGQLVAQAQELGLELDALVLEEEEEAEGVKAEPPGGEPAAPCAAALGALHRLAAEAGGRVRTFRRAVDLAAPFPFKETAPGTLFSGALEVCGAMRLPVRVLKRAQREALPAAGRAAPAAGAAAAPVALDREWFRADPETGKPTGGAVPPGERVRGYRYGRQTVPVPPDAEAALRYAPPKGLALLGFVPAEQLPRHLYMREPLVLLAKKGDAAAGTALAALARGMRAERAVAVLRYVARERSQVKLLAGEPVLAADAGGAGAGAAQHDCLVLNELPWLEDVRGFYFPSLAREDRAPSAAQLAAMDALVAAMALPPRRGAPPPSVDAASPCAAPAPALHSFLRLLARRAARPEGAPRPPEAAAVKQEEGAEQEGGVKDEGRGGASEPAPAAAGAAREGEPLPPDPLVDRVLGPRFGERDAGFAAAAAAAAAAFPTGLAGGARRAVHRLRPGRELDDFAAMLEQGAAPEAAAQMRRHVEALADGAAAEQGYALAAAALAGARAAAAAAAAGDPARRAAHAFDRALAALRAKYAGHAFPAKAEWWARRVEGAGIGPLAAKAEPAAGGGGGGGGAAAMEAD